MQRIVIEASSPSNMEHLLALLKQMDFVRNVWIEAAQPVDEFVMAGPPMGIDTFNQRIKQAEAEDAAGKSIADEDLTLDF